MITELLESYVDTATGVVLVKQNDGSYRTYIESKRVDRAFKLFGMPSVCSDPVTKALNHLAIHFRNRRV
jgi:predicted aminopeptidase